MDTRKKGLLKFITGGVAGIIATWYFAQSHEVKIGIVGPARLVAVALPGAYSMVGLLELVSGTPFGRLASKWDSLRGWQRSVIGLIVVAAAFIVAIFGMVLFGQPGS